MGLYGELWKHGMETQSGALPCLRQPVPKRKLTSTAAATYQTSCHRQTCLQSAQVTKTSWREVRETRRVEVEHLTGRSRCGLQLSLSASPLPCCWHERPLQISFLSFSEHGAGTCVEEADREGQTQLLRLHRHHFVLFCSRDCWSAVLQMLQLTGGRSPNPA